MIQFIKGLLGMLDAYDMRIKMLKEAHQNYVIAVEARDRYDAMAKFYDKRIKLLERETSVQEVPHDPV